MIQRAYPNDEAAFSTQVATPFLDDPATQAAFKAVFALLEGADSAREDITKDYLDRFNELGHGQRCLPGGRSHQYRGAHGVGLDGGAEVAQAGRALSDILKRIGYQILNFGASARWADQPGSGHCGTSRLSARSRTALTPMTMATLGTADRPQRPAEILPRTPQYLAK